MDFISFETPTHYKVYIVNDDSSILVKHQDHAVTYDIDILGRKPEINKDNDYSIYNTYDVLMTLQHHNSLYS